MQTYDRIVIIATVASHNQTRVGTGGPEATFSLIRSPQGGEWISAVVTVTVNKKNCGDAWGEL